LLLKNVSWTKNSTVWNSWKSPHFSPTINL
jgi:hypothetical protein